MTTTTHPAADYLPSAAEAFMSPRATTDNGAREGDQNDHASVDTEREFEMVNRKRVETLFAQMEPRAGEANKVEGVLNPAAIRGRDGHLYLFPRLVAYCNYSRLGLARMLFDSNSDPKDVERMGIALEPEADFAKNGGFQCHFRYGHVDLHTISLKKTPYPRRRKVQCGVPKTEDGTVMPDGRQPPGNVHSGSDEEVASALPPSVRLA